MKYAMTVSGPVAADKLGHILPHEHILMSFPAMEMARLYPELWERPVTMDILGKLRRDIFSCRDNLCLSDTDVALQELLTFKRSEGGTIVDVTTIGLQRDIQSVARLAGAAGVYVIVGTGCYIHHGHPAEISEMSIDALEHWMTAELTKGIEGSSIRAGIIGEIGVSEAGHPGEEKVLRAALRAHRATGAPVSIHQFGGVALEWIDCVVREESVMPERVILCHMSSVTEEQRLWAAKKGYYVEIDCFGNEYYSDALSGAMTRDPDRINMVKALIEKNFLRQILVSQDTALKILLKRYGGWGYEHLQINVRPMMLRAGIPPKAVDTLLYYNPMRVVAYLEG